VTPGSQFLGTLRRRVAAPLAGIAVALAAWWMVGHVVGANPATANFAGFAPAPALLRLGAMIGHGDVVRSVAPSLFRVGKGLLFAIAIGVPLGVGIGRNQTLRAATHIPFQFLRMISPLAWMPLAVMGFPSWEGAIVFLIAMAAVWPITFSTAHGVQRIDPRWFKVARNLGAEPWQMLRTVVLPAVTQDILTGVRLAVGVAWIVLVPAEYLGVTSGLGYAINDARDTLEYDRLAALVLVIGAIGFVLDGACLAMIRRFGWSLEA